jgi:hypothetical protein
LRSGQPGGGTRRSVGFFYIRLDPPKDRIGCKAGCAPMHADAAMQAHGLLTVFDIYESVGRSGLRRVTTTFVQGVSR